VKISRHNYVKTKATTIKTNLLEILQALTSQTADDALVVESLENIFSSYRVRFGRKLTPVRLASGNPGRHGAACA
jgi:hypothetical protein